MMRGVARIVGLQLRLCTWRHWVGAPMQTLALGAIVAVGVAVFLAVRMANAAAAAGFQDFAGLLGSAPDWIVSAPAGSLDESILPELRRRLGARPVMITPVFETTAARPRGAGSDKIGGRETFTILGLDLVALAAYAGVNANMSDAAGRPAGAWIDPKGVFISSELARSDRLKPGDRLPLVVQDRVETFVIEAVLPDRRDAPGLSSHWLLMDLPAAQEVAGLRGRIDRVELLVEPGPDRDQRREALRPLLEERASGRWIVASPASRRTAAVTMTRAFEFNLTLLSLLALAVGAGLVFQALDGAALRRRDEIAVLVSLGVTPREIAAAWVLESAALGLAGGAAGLPLGWLGASGAMALVGRTINALYYATDAHRAVLGLRDAGWALLAALIAGILAGCRPAGLASATPPAQWLGRTTSTPRRGRPAVLVAVGAAAALGAWAAAQAGPLELRSGFRLPLGGYVSLALWVGAGGCLAGGSLSVLGGQGAPATGRAAWRTAFSYLRFPTVRHHIAAASITAAVAMTAGMAVLVASFDLTMRRWIDAAFHADLYLASDGAQGAASKNRLPAATWRAIIADPAVAEAIVTQVTSVELPSGRAVLVGSDLAAAFRRQTMLWISSPRGDDAPAVMAGAACVVSESFANRFHLRRGSEVTLPLGPGGWRLAVAGVYADYGNEHGSITVNRPALVARVNDDGAAAMTVFLKPGVDADAVRLRWRDARPGLRVYSNAHLRSEIMRIFRETFSITHALEVIGLAAAVAGLALTLISVFLERRADLFTLRALGFARRDTAAIAAAEGGLLATSGAAAGIACGMAMGRVLVFVVNRQTFGWTLQISTPWATLALLAFAVVVAGAVTAFLAGWWAAQLPADPEE
jgi:putative ABC transport system permease protein